MRVKNLPEFPALKDNKVSREIFREMNMGGTTAESRPKESRVCLFEGGCCYFERKDQI